MPKFSKPQLVSQKGSVLVMVLGLSMAMSMAAASLMWVAGNSINGEDASFRRMQCYNDAESGLLIGTGWLRNHPNSVNIISTNQISWTAGGQVIFSGALENGSSVTVKVIDNAPAAPPNAPKTVAATAVKGDITLQLRCDVDIRPGAPAGTPPNLSLTNWQLL
ncbi:MAG: hypothetical protein JWP91_940 [Fibrobacteres bacterium]|nr:hypothetical protein [Fibrobacterota bacterium]